MDKKNDNQKSAFPVYALDDGMTLRDYFAAKAMQALVGSEFVAGDYAAHAKQAYKYADAMMDEREAYERRAEGTL